MGTSIELSLQTGCLMYAALINMKQKRDSEVKKDDSSEIRTKVKEEPADTAEYSEVRDGNRNEKVKDAEVRVKVEAKAKNAVEATNKSKDKGVSAKSSKGL